MVRGDSRKRKQLYCIKISSSIPSIFSTKESLSLENYNSCGMADNHTEQRPHPIEYGEDSFKKQLSSKLFTLVRILSFLVCGAFIIDLKSATNLFVRLALLIYYSMCSRGKQNVRKRKKCKSMSKLRIAYMLCPFVIV